MITFQPDAPPLFNANRMVAILRGRLLAREALSKQAVGDVEKLKHEQAIADIETQIEQLQSAGGVA